MAANRLSQFNWSKLAESVSDPRNARALQNKANEIMATHGRFAAAPAAINFGEYKSKLKFTGSAVDKLEAAFKNQKLSDYHATVPQFVSDKRTAMNSVIRDTVAAAALDLEAVNAQIETFSANRLTAETSISEVKARFPDIARETETEIKNHDWFEDVPN